MKIKVEDGRERFKPAPSGVRETIIWVLFCLILAAGAFGWGYIYKDHRVDDLREKIYQLDVKQRDINGRLIAIESVEGGLKPPRGAPALPTPQRRRK